MSSEMACTCSDLPSHSHIGRWVYTGERGIFPTYQDTGEVRIWVDWKAVARALAGSEAHT